MISLVRRLAASLFLLIPPLALALAGWRAFVDRADQHLARLTPIVALEASRYLDRPVSVQRIRPAIALADLVDIWRRPAAYTSLPLRIEGLALGNRPAEAALAGRELLARAQRVIVEVSVPGLLGGHPSQEALRRVFVDGLDLTLVRNRAGRFNVEDLLPQPTERPDPRKPPFATQVEVHRSSLRFRDFASGWPVVQENDFVAVDGGIDLSGSRLARYTLTARAARLSATASRLGGGLALSGSLARGVPGSRVDSPSADSPRYVFQVRATDGDAGYWYRYWMPNGPFQVRQGRATVHFSAIGQRPEAPGKPNAPSLLQAQVAFRDASVRVPSWPSGRFERLTGQLSFDDTVLQFQVRGRAMGIPLQTAGLLWGLRAGPGAPGASVFARADMAPLALREGLRAFGVAAPAELRGNPSVSLRDVTIQGPLASPRIVAGLALDRFGWQGIPTLDRVQGRIAVVDGRVVVDSLAAVGLGGAWQGEGEFRFASVRGGAGLALEPLGRREARFSVRVRGAQLKDLAWSEVLAQGQALPIGGVVDATVLGTWRGGRWRVGGRAGIKQPSWSGYAFDRGDVAFRFVDSVLRLDAARLVSRDGLAALAGRVSGAGWALEGRLSGWDAGRLSAKGGYPGVQGLVSCRVRILGAFASPTVQLRSLVGLNLAYRADGRRWSVDAARCDRLRIARTPKGSWGIHLDEPLVLHRAPASVTVLGAIDRLERVHGRVDPRLGLRVQVNELDLAELAQQFEPEAGRFAPAAVRETPEVAQLMRRVHWSGPERSTVAASILDAMVQVNGTLSRPRVSGSARLGRMLLGAYPIDEGQFSFAYAAGVLSVDDFRLLASVGELRARGKMNAAGELTGHFDAPRLEMTSLSFLTDGYAPLAGAVSVSGELSGTRTHPVVVAQIDPRSRIDVAGTPLTQVTGRDLRLEAELRDQGKARLLVSAGQLSFQQASTRIAIEDFRFEPESGALGLRLAITDGDLETLTTALRRSRLDETAEGERLLRALDDLPSPLGGRFRMEAAGTAVLAEGRLSGRHLSAQLHVEDLQVGPAVAQRLSAAARLDGDRVTVERMEIQRQDALVQLKPGGTVELPSGEGSPYRFNVTLDSIGASLDLVRAFVPSFPLQGAVDITVALSGTSDAPHVTASVLGENLNLLTAAKKIVPISRIGFEADFRQDASGQGVIQINDGQFVHGGEGSDIDRLRFDGTIPFEQVPVAGENARRGGRRYRFAESRAMDMALQVERLGLDALASLAGGDPRIRLGGRLEGRVGVRGTLRHPALEGALDLRDGQVRLLPGAGEKRDPLNAISEWTARLELAGERLRVRDTRMRLAVSPDKKRPGGSVEVAGEIVLGNLADLRAQLSGERGTSGRDANQDAGYRLTVRFNGFHPDTNNITQFLLTEPRGGLGEAIRGRIDGLVRVSGPLMAPRVATDPERPLTLTETVLKLPIREGPGRAARANPAFNPEFDIAVEIPRVARVESQSLFQFLFEASGGMQIRGTAGDPFVQADLQAERGAFQYATAVFYVKRGGTITLAYGSRNTGVRVEGLEAEARVTTGSAGFGAVPGAPNGRLRIIARLDGPLDLLGDSALRGRQGTTVTLSSDPSLSREEILRVIGSDAQLQQLARGDAEGALRTGFVQVYNNFIVRRLLDQLTGNWASRIGLDDLRLDYNPDGTATILVSASLPRPLERFNATLTRSFQIRNTPNQSAPLLYSINYDLYQFRPRSRYQPRVQVGVSSNEQRNVSYFLRGTVTY